MLNEHHYSNFHYIDDESRLASFFNRTMNSLHNMRMLCAPDSFRKDETIADFQDQKFADFCRYELWMHATVGRLRKWQQLINDYFAEYNGSWKYYAAAHRLSAITEYGGEADDYEDDGMTVRTEGLADERYFDFTILRDLYDENWKDIVQDTVPLDLRGFCADLMANSKIDLLQGLRMHFGDKVKAFCRDENGEMQPLTPEQHTLNMISGQVDAEDDAKRITGIIGCVQGIIQFIRQCRYNDDNTELLQMVGKASAGLLNLDWETVEGVIKNFADKYAQE